MYIRIPNAVSRMDKTIVTSWDNLTADQREQILKSYEESEDPANLVAHEEVMKQYGKWLMKETFWRKESEYSAL
jgi:hypothetical protein